MVATFILLSREYHLLFQHQDVSSLLYLNCFVNSILFSTGLIFGLPKSFLASFLTKTSIKDGDAFSSERTSESSVFDFTLRAYLYPQARQELHRKD
jgi:hypothetical protein